MKNFPSAPVTITALFMSTADAKKVLAQLEKSGVAPENIGVSDANVLERREVDDKESWWNRLFHRDHLPKEHKTHYEEHLRKGATLIAVEVDEALVDDVVDLFNYYGAKDFSGESLRPLPHPRDRATAPAPTAPPHAATDVEPFSGTPIPQPADSDDEDALPPIVPATPAYSDESLMMERRRDVQNHPEIERRSERRGGVRVYSQLSNEPRPDDMDGDFQTHHRVTHDGSTEDYDQYAAAYRYGARVSALPEYRSKSYEDVEPALKEDFHYKGIDDEWSRVREAVKYGFERKRRAAAPAPVDEGAPNRQR